MPFMKRMYFTIILSAQVIVSLAFFPAASIGADSAKSNGSNARQRLTDAQKREDEERARKDQEEKDRKAREAADRQAREEQQQKDQEERDRKEKERKQQDDQK